MVSEKLVLLLLYVFCLPVAFCLPVLRENSGSNREVRSAPEPASQYPLLSRLNQDVPLLRQWELTPAADDDYPSNYMRIRHDAKRARNFMDDPAHPRPDGHHAHQRTMDYPVAKRNEEANIPTMGLGVLSDMRKFFNDLRVNLDSVEEAAALSQEQGSLRSIDPADFLAFLARHGARSNELASGELGLLRNPTHMRRLMFGYNHDDQPYVHSGLGK